MKYTPDNIAELKENEIFVFGSNRSGFHGKGAALTARQKFGAKYAVGEGLTGKCYALPTKGHNLSNMTLEEIKKHVDIFLKFAKDNPDKIFLVTQIGCGLAGHKPKDIAPMFKERTDNVIIPKEFQVINKWFKIFEYGDQIKPIETFEDYRNTPILIESQEAWMRN